MDLIQLPSDRFAQPFGQVPVSVGWRNRGLVSALTITPGGGIHDHVNGTTYMPTGAIETPDSYGRVLKLDGSGDYVNIGAQSIGGINLFADASNTWSVVICARLETSSNVGTFISRAGTDAPTRTFQIFRDTTDANQDPSVILRGGQTMTNWDWTTADWHQYAVTWDGSVGTLYGDNTHSTALTVGTAAEESQNIILGARTGGAGFFLTGRIAYCFFFNRSVGRAEAHAIYYNPWQVFEEETSYVFIPGTSTSHDLSISNLTQSNTVSEPSISQVHVLDFFDPTFFNTLSSPSVTQNHVLDVFDPTFFNTLSEPSISLNGEITLDISNLTSANSMSDVSIEVSRTLSISNLTQSNNLSQVSISQVHVLDIFDPTFFNLISNVEVDLAEGIVYLTINSLTQTNTLSQSSVLIPPNNNTLVSKHIVPV